MPLRHLVAGARRLVVRRPLLQPRNPPIAATSRRLSSQLDLATASIVRRRSLLSTPPNHGFRIEVMDSDLWSVSFGIAESLQSSATPETVDDFFGEGGSDALDPDPDADADIDDMRLRRRLFYKLDRGSMEFEESEFVLRRRRRNRRSNWNEFRKPEPKRSDFMRQDPEGFQSEKLLINPSSAFTDGGVSKGNTRIRVPSLNQRTEIYHLPFCLDIHVTKGSVRACVVHRVTSRVVAVAHSISKDMMFDVKSRKGVKACAAVGAVLAKRAIEDDIHNVVYTPRKGDRIEGKLQVVLQSVMDHGVDVKVRLKQKQRKKLPMATAQ